MIERKYLKEITGIVKDIFIPRIYDKNNSEYLLDSEVDKIGFIVQTDNNKQLKIIVKKDVKSTSIYVDDKVTVNIYGILYDYENYRSKLYEKVYLENSYLSDLEINSIFYNKVISKEKYDENSSYIYEYEIV